MVLVGVVGGLEERAERRGDRAPVVVVEVGVAREPAPVHVDHRKHAFRVDRLHQGDEVFLRAVRGVLDPFVDVAATLPAARVDEGAETNGGLQ